MRRILGTLLLAALLPLMLPEAATAVTRVEYARQTLGRTNTVRANHGLHTLQRTDCLGRFAWAQAKAMASQRRMFHQSLTPIMSTCHLRLAGENVAYGYWSGRQVVRAWMRSPEHRANILKPGYRQIAIGAVRGSNGLWYVSQVFGRHV
ncbi:CAP domain-containing protein [Nocardioides montaniterrae]